MKASDIAYLIDLAREDAHGKETPLIRELQKIYQAANSRKEWNVPVMPNILRVSWE